jgi:hypothetical protein
MMNLIAFRSLSLSGLLAGLYIYIHIDVMYIKRIIYYPRELSPSLPAFRLSLVSLYTPKYMTVWVTGERRLCSIP